MRAKSTMLGDNFELGFEKSEAHNPPWERMAPPVRAPRSLPGRLSMAVLLGFAPFFCWPWKPVINTLLGTPYAVALKNFKEQHADPANLALHVVALAATLAANFALLDRIDAFVPQPVPGARSVSAFTALAWAATLMNSPAPLSARLLSVLAIVWAFALASYVQPAQVKGTRR